MITGAIILAAGSGSRYNGKKQDIEFHGKPLWKYPYDATVEYMGKENVIVVGKEIEGGKTRSESVQNGLRALSGETERVVILDAARPLVTVMQIKQILESPYPSVSFVRPLVNTVVYRDGRYVNRDDLYDLLVPQAFDYKLLVEAYGSGRFDDMTDETRVMYEYHGIKPNFIETDNNLFKITYPGDLQILESIYQRQMRK